MTVPEFGNSSRAKMMIEMHQSTAPIKAKRAFQVMVASRPSNRLSTIAMLLTHL